MSIVLTLRKALQWELQLLRRIRYTSSSETRKKYGCLTSNVHKIYKKLKNNNDMKAKFVKCIVVLSAMLMALCVLAGCEKKKETPKYKDVKISAIFYPRNLSMEVDETAEACVYVDHNKINNPRNYNIQFSSSNEDLISVDKDGNLIAKMVSDISRADSVVYVSLYCESGGRVYKDTMQIKVFVPHGLWGDEEYDLNKDGKLSVYESVRIIRIVRDENGPSIIDSNLRFFPNVVFIQSNFFSLDKAISGIKSVFDFGANKKLEKLIFWNYDACPGLFEIKLSDNQYLEDLTIENTVKYGKNLPVEPLDLSMCPNLKLLSLIRTDIKKLSSSSADKIEEVTLEGNNYLETVDLSNCNNLKKVIVDIGNNPMTLVLSKEVYKKYVNKSQDLIISVPDYVKVTQTE